MYEGRIAMKNYILDSIKRQPENTTLSYAFEAGNLWHNLLDGEFDTWNNLRIKKGIKLKAILTGNNEFKIKYKSLFEYKMINADLEISANFNIWGDSKPKFL